MRLLPTIHTFHQSLEEMHWFEAIFKMFGGAVFEVIEVATSKFNLERHLTSMASQTALPNILKEASNQCICSKDWWKVWIVDRDRTETKCPKQWGVGFDYFSKSFLFTKLFTVWNTKKSDDCVERGSEKRNAGILCLLRS